MGLLQENGRNHVGEKLCFSTYIDQFYFTKPSHLARFFLFIKCHIFDYNCLIDMKRLFLITLLTVLTTGIFASAGGGVFYGDLYYNEDFANRDVSDSGIIGGYGYGTGRDGTRTGGFGLAITNEDGEGYTGGFGGLITGRETFVGPILLGTNLWLGVGGLDEYGFSGFAEINGEIGLAVFPWMQLQLYGGIQGITPFSDFLDKGTYAPVGGFRVVWGSFYNRRG